MPRPIRFLRRGRPIEIARIDPMATVLDWLRLEERSTGTKEGCNEGDCGACTVVLRRVVDGRLRADPVNACILLVGQLDGAELITVEDLAQGGALHPVQAAMVAHHASQCGFCTPGIVMSLFALHHAEGAVTRQRVLDQLAGNLCRCTGYRPIVEAALEACAAPAADLFAANREDVTEALLALDDGADVFVGDDSRFFAAPATLDAACDLATRHPDAVILAGATDVGLWITKRLADLPKILWLGRVASLRAVEETGGVLRIGAMVSHAEAMPRLAVLDPDLGEVLRRFGSVQVRASGTVGGNIANGSPIGDLAPAFIALNAFLHLRHGARERSLPLESFFLDYGKQDRAKGELVTGLSVPKPGPAHAFRAFKLTKRFDEDISAVMLAVRLTLAGERITEARIACGGMAATPRRAPRTEAALTGLTLSDRAAWTRAADSLADDYRPIGDMRASAGYRRDAARALLLKALMEISGTDSALTRLTGRRPAPVAADATP